MRALRLHAMFAAACVAGCNAAEPDPAAPPDGWFLSGSDPAGFRAAVDDAAPHAGRASGRLESIDPETAGAATLMQSVSADPYRGRRVRFAAFVRADRVARWAGLWMRIDRAGGGSAFDDMHDRPVRGTTAWTRHAVVLDVPADAIGIQYGLLLDGPGVSWIDDVALELVGRDVPPTGADRRPRALENGGFEAGDRWPAGWTLSGFGADDIEVAVDRGQSRSGASSAHFKSRVDEPRGLAIFGQSIRADAYRGKRIQMSGWGRGARVSARLGVSVAGGSRAPGTAGGAACPLAGTFDWTRCRVVIDVPELADEIELELAMAGGGSLWLDDVVLEEVSPDVALTDVERAPPALVNGDFEAPGGEPRGWFLSGGARNHYAVQVDRATAHGGGASARLEPRVDRPLGYGTLMQHIAADRYRGRRVQLRAAVRGRGIDARGDLWARVQAADSPGDGPGLGGGRKQLSGSFDWQLARFVFDVPERGAAIQMGVGLAGHGAIWLDDVQLDLVGDDVPLDRGDFPPLAVENGRFEDGRDGPRGWFLSGGAADDFQASLDRSAPGEGGASAHLRARVPAPRGYGTLMQSIRAETYRGRRLRMSALVRADRIGDGGFWLRVQAAYSPDDGPGLGGDQCRLTGTTGWKSCEIVFDVPDEAVAIQYGIGLDGPGALSLDRVELEPVSVAIPVTGVVRRRTEPTNLDFEASTDHARSRP